MANLTLDYYYCAMLKPEGHHDLWNANASLATLSNCVVELWRSARVTVIRTEILVVLVATCSFFMASFGSWRRRSRNLFIQYGVLGARTLSSSLLPFTLGAMHSSMVKSSMYPIWALSLYILIGSVNSVTAYSLNDNDQQTSKVFSFLLCEIYVLIIIGLDSELLGAYLITVASYKIFQQMWAWYLASTSWNLNKLVADYMYEEHIKSGPSYDPANMKGYHYLVDWPLGESKLEDGMLYARDMTTNGAQIIDIENVMLCKGLSPYLKDMWLSFALFHLLRRHFFGFACAESSQQKTHDFVFKGLLSKNEDGAVDYNRVFNVIEVELAFMYDFFFTKYPVLYYSSKTFSTIWSVASAILVSVTAYQTIGIASKPHGPNFLHTTTGDVAITVLILTCIALLEVLQVFHYWRTIWGKVSFACHYIRKQEATTRRRICQKRFQKGRCKRFREIILTKMIIGVSMSSLGKGYYQNNLGQYSLLESVNCKHNPPKKGPSKFMQRNCGLLLFPYFSHLCEETKYFVHARCNRKGCGKLGAVKLPADVKKALVHCLPRTQGVLRSAESSLAYNEAHDLSWACRKNLHSNSRIRCRGDTENKTDIIMTWHIATCYNEMATLKFLSPREGGELKFHLHVATILSKYCVYLVVSAPKLLPGHHYDTSLSFYTVAEEAGLYLRNVEDKYEAMRSLPELIEKSIFCNGVKLGRQLEEIKYSRRWKVLADFWTEMLLYLAPSDSVKEHIECLANGGEFLTHLWALLSHAGILDREKRIVNDIENTGANRSCPGEESYVDALRFRRTSSQPLTCAEKTAAIATCSLNQPSTNGKYAESLEISVEGGRTDTSGQGGGNDQIQVMGSKTV